MRAGLRPLRRRVPYCAAQRPVATMRPIAAPCLRICRPQHCREPCETVPAAPFRIPFGSRPAAARLRRIALPQASPDPDCFRLSSSVDFLRTYLRSVPSLRRSIPLPAVVPLDAAGSASASPANPWDVPPPVRAWTPSGKKSPIPVVQAGVVPAASPPSAFALSVSAPVFLDGSPDCALRPRTRTGRRA